MFKLLGKRALSLIPVLLLFINIAAAFAAGGFTLGPGNFVIWPGADPKVGTTREAVQYWKKVNLEVKEDGTFVTNVRTNITTKDPKYNSVTVSTYDIDIKGQYDSSDGTFSGNFTITDDYHYVRKFEAVEGVKFHDSTRDGTSIFNGKIGGKATKNASSVELLFTGKYSDKYHSVSQNGREEDYSNSFDDTHTVRFPVQGAIPAPEFIPEDSGAGFSDIYGEVSILIPIGVDENGKELYDEEDWRVAKLDQKLPVGTRIKTEGKSGVILSFADMTTFEMKPESEIILSSPTPKKEGQFELLYGQLKANFTHMIKYGDLPIEGSQAVAGIKGTVFVLEDDKQTTTLKVLDGTVEFTPKNGDKAVVVKSGETAKATAAGITGPSPFDVKTEAAKWKTPATSPEPKPGTTGKQSSPKTPLYAGGAASVVTIIIVLVFAATRRKKN